MRQAENTVPQKGNNQDINQIFNLDPVYKVPEKGLDADA
jgi:hypothetical protein